jgi:predicted GIY-YIG superfamily endonuclease
MQNKYWVYKITSPSLKVYIGITSNIIKRFGFYKNHFLLNQTAIYNSIKKYGWDNHTKEILFISLTKEEAELKEIELIKYYKETKKCLNIADGGLYPPIRDINSLCKPIYQCDLDGNIIKEWESAALIEITLDISGTNIGRACRRKYFHQYGYLWIFKKDFEEGIKPFYTNRIGKGKAKEIFKINSKKEIIESFSSLQETIKNYKFKNAKRNILKSLKFQIPDEEGYYYIYKK